MEILDSFLAWLRSFAWYWELPAVVREPPGLWIALLSAVGLAVWLLWRGPGWLGSLLRRDPESARVRQQIRDLRRADDWVGVGRLYETLGKNQPALDAFRKGGHAAERADLLIRIGRRGEAKEVAREGQLWALYAELCEGDGEHAEAAAAYERGGQDYAAARCYEADGQLDLAAACYQRAGLDGRAIELLAQGRGRSAADTLEAALRSSFDRDAPHSDESFESSVRRGAQLWLEQGEAERAYRLAVDTEQWGVAVPIVRDHLEPTVEAAEVCTLAEQPLVAAEIYERLGDRRQAALARADHALRQENAEEAAQWYESAEEWTAAADQWAAAGATDRAARLFARVGDFRQAASLFEHAGDAESARQMLARGTAAPLELAQPSPDSATFGEAPTVVAPAQPFAPSAGGISEPSALAPQDRYVLGDELGRGGMGTVFRAHDQMLEREVAYKRVTAEFDAGETDALLAEARAAARLSHPNIVQIYDAGRDAQGFYLVMELVDGKTLDKLLDTHKLSLPQVLGVARQVTAALEHAHQRRVIHRDLKPSNLLWTAEGQVKLTDFGLARLIEDSLGKVLTRPAGTPSYMAPEQIRGEAVDPRVDLYALGCVLFEMLCNRGPFGGGSSIYQHLNTPPRDPRHFRDDVPATLAELVTSCLAKDPDQRPESAQAVARILASVG